MLGMCQEAIQIPFRSLVNMPVDQERKLRPNPMHSTLASPWLQAHTGEKSMLASAWSSLVSTRGGRRSWFCDVRSHSPTILLPNAPMSGATARSAEASAPLAGWAALPQPPLSLVWALTSIGRLVFPTCHCYGLRSPPTRPKPGRLWRGPFSIGLEDSHSSRVVISVAWFPSREFFFLVTSRLNVLRTMSMLYS